MKILVICQYYYPVMFKLVDICEDLVTRGHTVTVVTGLPNYPDGVIPEEYKDGKNREETHNGVKIIRCYEIARGHGPVRLGLNYISFMLSATRKLKQMRDCYDIIFVYQQSPVMMAYPAIRYKKRHNTPIYLYCCDIWPDSLKMYIHSEKNPIYKIVKLFSTKIYRSCNMVGVTSKPFIEYFNRVHGVSAEKLTYLPNHAEDNSRYPIETIDNGVVDFVFTGNIGIAQDIGCIIEAVDEIKDIPGFHVHFVGSGSYEETAKNLCHVKNLEKYITFHGRHPVEKMTQFYQLADYCLLTLKADSLVGLTMPSKLQGYMAAGKPVIAAINGAAREVIEEADCGISVDAEHTPTCIGYERRNYA